GSFLFTSLRPGVYTVTETQPAGLFDGRTTAGTQGGTAVTNQITFTATSSTNGTGNTFAELLPASISGAVYVDANGNGRRDAADAASAYLFGETGAANDDMSKRQFLGTTSDAGFVPGAQPQGLSLPNVMPVMGLAAPFIVTAPDVGAPPIIRVSDPVTGAERF